MNTNWGSAGLTKILKLASWVLSLALVSPILFSVSSIQPDYGLFQSALVFALINFCSFNHRSCMWDFKYIKYFTNISYFYLRSLHIKISFLVLQLRRKKEFRKEFIFVNFLYNGNIASMRERTKKCPIHFLLLDNKWERK